jgi:hypothetical protein
VSGLQPLSASMRRAGLLYNLQREGSYRGWYQDDALPFDWRIEVSENGWTTDEIGLRWLRKVFIPATTSRTIGRYRLLIIDSHGSHLTPAFDKACKDNDSERIGIAPLIRA